MKFIHHICRYICKLITHTLTQNQSNLSSCKRVKQVNCPKIPEICLTQQFRIKNINVIKHHKKIQRNMSRKHQIKLSIHFQLNIFNTQKTSKLTQIF